MRTEDFRRGLGSILLVSAIVLLMTLATTLVLAPAFISYPVGTIDVIQGQTFTLRYRLAWNEPGVPESYSIAIGWDYFADNAWHFTFVSAVAYFDNNGDDLPDPGVALIDNIVSTADNGTRYTIAVSNAVGNDNDGTFNVDITLRASGPDSTPHAVTDNHLIEYIIQLLEDPLPVVIPGSVTVRVIEAPPWTGTAVFGLENLYVVSLEKNLDLYQGSKLVVRFYTYWDAFENESVIDNFVPPWHVEENVNVPHPQGGPMEKATLDLTTSNTENVISTIARGTI